MELGWQTKISDEWLHILPQPVNLMRPLDVANLAALIAWVGTASSSSTPWPAAWLGPTKTRPRTAASPSTP